MDAEVIKKNVAFIYTLFRLKGSQHKVKPIAAIRHKNKQK